MNRQAYTQIEVVVIVATAVVATALLLPIFNNRGINHRPMQNSGQLRGIHTGMLIYAQGNGGYYPGLSKSGEPVDVTVESRFRILLEERDFTGDYMIAPGDKKQPWTAGPVHSGQYSYAMASLAEPGERRGEWRETTNLEAVSLSDRLIVTGSGNLASIHTTPPRGIDDWRGSVAWNDGHVTYEQSPIVRTRHGKVVTLEDNLFEAAGRDDASMVYSGE